VRGFNCILLILLPIVLLLLLLLLAVSGIHTPSSSSGGWLRKRDLVLGGKVAETCGGDCIIDCRKMKRMEAERSI
jgi:hypothetical protein